MLLLLKASQHLMPLAKSAARTDSGAFMKNRASANFEYFVVLAGVVLAIVTEFKSGSPSLWYVLWAALPYGIYALAAMKAGTGATVGGGLLILGIDMLIRVQVAFSPGSSTDSIALLIMPFWQIVVIMPMGFLLGWLVEKMINRFTNQQTSRG
mgnify:FL=1